MIRNTKLWVVFIFIAFFVSGCGEGKGEGFVGKWVGKNNERMLKPSYVMIISRDGENFHVDIATTQDAFGVGKPTTSNRKLEAKAESNTVLSMFGGLATMRLEKDTLSFDGTSFTRSD
ncbi:hypothetical protein [Pseudomonas fluorescens]